MGSDRQIRFGHARGQPVDWDTGNHHNVLDTHQVDGSDTTISYLHRQIVGWCCPHRPCRRHRTPLSHPAPLGISTRSVCDDNATVAMVGIVGASKHSSIEPKRRSLLWGYERPPRGIYDLVLDVFVLDAGCLPCFVSESLGERKEADEPIRRSHHDWTEFSQRNNRSPF